MNKKKIISAIAGVIIVGISICTSIYISHHKNITNQDSQKIEQRTSPEEQLLKYNEEGMKILKANYTDTDEMKLALNNIGNSFLDFKFTGVHDNEIKLSQFKGKKVLLTIEQPNCSYCIENEKFLETALKDKDIIHVSLLEKADKEAVNTYYEGLGYKEVPQYVGYEKDVNFGAKTGVFSTPTSFFIDEDGKVSFVYTDAFNENTFNDALKIAYSSNKIYNMLQK